MDFEKYPSNPDSDRHQATELSYWRRFGSFMLHSMYRASIYVPSTLWPTAREKTVTAPPLMRPPELSQSVLYARGYNLAFGVWMKLLDSELPKQTPVAQEDILNELMEGSGIAVMPSDILSKGELSQALSIAERDARARSVFIK